MQMLQIIARWRKGRLMAGRVIVLRAASVDPCHCYMLSSPSVTAADLRLL